MTSSSPPEGALVQRLDVLQFVHVRQSFSVDLALGKGIEHERVVGIGTVGDVHGAIGHWESLWLAAAGFLQRRIDVEAVVLVFLAGGLSLGRFGGDKALLEITTGRAVPGCFGDPNGEGKAEQVVGVLLEDRVGLELGANEVARDGGNEAEVVALVHVEGSQHLERLHGHRGEDGGAVALSLGGIAHESKSSRLFMTRLLPHYFGDPDEGGHSKALSTALF